jgi:hypothetical protein
MIKYWAVFEQKCDIPNAYLSNRFVCQYIRKYNLNLKRLRGSCISTH